MSTLSPDEAARIVDSDQKKRKMKKEKQDRENQEIIQWIIDNHGANEEDIDKVNKAKKMMGGGMTMKDKKKMMGYMGGGMTKMKYKKGGKVKKRKIDGVAKKGKTRGKMV